MIQANELRIGSYIDTVGGIQRVEFIAPDGVHLSDGDIRSIEQIEPILLAPEILEKCGFITADAEVDLMEYTKGDVSIKNDGGLDDEKNQPYYFEDGDFRKFKIKHLHQLQNLFFALTGTELEINIDKLQKEVV